jgi:hypothetical protein
MMVFIVVAAVLAGGCTTAPHQMPIANTSADQKVKAGTVVMLDGRVALLVAARSHSTRRWKDYLYGEYMYVVLSIVAETTLAWQAFAGTLR